MVRITALMDDKTTNPLCMAAHGLSYLVQTPEISVLFDCGPGTDTWRNARALGEDIYNVDAVVLSHSHYDHAGGYPSLVEAVNGGSLLYTGPGFFEKKYSFDGTGYHDRSAGFDETLPKANGITHVTVSDVKELAPGMYLVGDFPRVHKFETIPGKYVRKTGGNFVPDDFRDEIAMAVDVGGKLAVLVGCAHPGILNMVKHIQEALNRPVCAVFGGVHLLDAEERRISATLEALHGMGVELLGLGHCSGEQAEAMAAGNHLLRSCHLGAGDSLEL